jgi:hypothetical protein
MGEKPMGTPVDEEELDPTAGAAGINTTRSNIKNAGGVAATTEAGTAGGGAEPSGYAVKEQGVK